MIKEKDYKVFCLKILKLDLNKYIKNIILFKNTFC